VTTHDEAVEPLVFALHGDIDLLTADGVAGAVSVARAARRSLVLDVSHVTFMDSEGINALLEARRTMTEWGFAIRGPKQPIRRLIELTGLSDVLVIVD
jgi:anti-anti-sigma factor